MRSLPAVPFCPGSSLLRKSPELPGLPGTSLGAAGKHRSSRQSALFLLCSEWLPRAARLYSTTDPGPHRTAGSAPAGEGCGPQRGTGPLPKRTQASKAAVGGGERKTQ